MIFYIANIEINYVKNEDLNVIRVFITIMLLVSCLFTVQSKAYAQQAEHQVDNISAKHFLKVDDNYYRGANPKKEYYEQLDKLGIKSIIDLRLLSERKYHKMENYAETYNMKVYSIPLNPFKPPSSKQVEEFFNIIDNPDNQPVYVHCTHGQDRTGIMTALYRVNKYNWNYDKAYEEMKHDGFHPHLYRNQLKFLKKYLERKEAAEKGR
jgi:protein tyrosine/serine phosphatase